ncbi:hypothetical protein BDW74DRAFT_174561 [Aspergillus multicolor]|uniref:uncharacterized protein n=1 Tax=Aspergillus multicolor TaxID=41759 RepID=UPI003CCDD5A7
MEIKPLSLWSRFKYRVLHNPGNAEATTVANVQKRSHWIRAVYLCAYISSAVLLINLVFLAVAEKLAADIRDQDGSDKIISGTTWTFPETQNSSDKVLTSWAFQEIYDGSCALSERWSLAIHLMINILGTIVLAASNYTMQTLVAPCREEVDEQHRKGHWLDIGASSIKNLRVVGRYRAAIWAVLLATATPFHLLYNSAVYTVIATNAFTTVLTASDLEPSKIFDYTTPEVETCFNATETNWSNFSSAIMRGVYTRVDENECAEFRKREYRYGVETVVLLSDELSVHGPSDRWFLAQGEDIEGPNDDPRDMPGVPLISQEFAFQHTDSRGRGRDIQSRQFHIALVREYKHY